MKRIMVRYTVKPDTAADNVRYMWNLGRRVTGPGVARARLEPVDDQG
jgi:hypothetical protein